MSNLIKIRITYNTGLFVETIVSKYTFDYYTQDRHEWYKPDYITTNIVASNNNEYISLYGAIKIERVDDEVNTCEPMGVAKDE